MTTLTQLAHHKLTTALRGYGNKPSADHQQALFALVQAMTDMAEGRLQGRYAFGMPTGMGKTLSIISWLSAVNSLGLSHFSTAVAASKVEALCQLKRDLIGAGIPAERVGLLHSHTDASEPATADNEDRPIMLVTHSRIMGGKLETFTTYKGTPRSVLFWDESLIASESLFVVSNMLEGGIGFLERAYREDDAYTDLVQYLNACSRCIQAELKRQKETPTEGGGVMHLPTCVQLSEFKALVGTRHQALDPVRVLLDLVNRPLRVVVLSGQRGVVSYQITLPEALRNIIVLDASQPIRKLVHLDSTIQDAERVLPALQMLKTPLSQLKRYDRVTLHQQFAGGGRSTLEKDFAQKYRVDRKVTKSIIEVVQQIPPGESILIFTYKGLVYGGASYKDIVLRDLQAAGVEMTLPGSGRRRIDVLTWGHEASLNSFSHCKHVILAGVLQRNPVDLAGAYLGQKDNLQAAMNQDIIRELLLSEVCHVVYQALSRGACRVVQDGTAGEMHGYLIHRDEAIRGELEKVMPGAVWKVWGEKGVGGSGTIAAAARTISEYLRGLPEDVALMSTRKVKHALGLDGLPSRTFTYALQRSLIGSGWMLSKQSVMRA